MEHEEQVDELTPYPTAQEVHCEFDIQVKHFDIKY